MENFPLGVTSAEYEFYGDRLILLEGAIEEFLSCLHMIRRYQVSQGLRDPVASFQARIKSAKSMRAKLERHRRPVTTDSALQNVWDAAGIRLVCPFVQNIDQMVSLIRQIPDIRILREKDYIRNPKPNGYRSYHMILSLPLRFLEKAPEPPVWLEVQLRTIAMDCWANIEHQLKYKQDIANQALIVQELKRCADEIASTDLSLQTIRELIEAPVEQKDAIFGISVAQISEPGMGWQTCYSTPGLYVTQTSADNGLKAGDRIIQIDGAGIDNASDISAVLGRHSVGDSVKVVVSRSGRETVVSVKLTEQKPS